MAAMVHRALASGRYEIQAALRAAAWPGASARDTTLNRDVTPKNPARVACQRF
jgi:hypothetical protein